MSMRKSVRYFLARETSFISSVVITKRSLEVEQIAMSAMASSEASSFTLRGSPPQAAASSTARSRLRLSTKSLAPCLARCLAALSPILPAPTRSTRFPRSSSKIRAARSHAIELTETEPAAMPVSVRTFLATAKALVKQRSSTDPSTPALEAFAYASFTCPRIWGSPTTIESRLDATRNACRTALVPSCT
jgi:hypothetical protein